MYRSKSAALRDIPETVARINSLSAMIVCLQWPWQIQLCVHKHMYDYAMTTTHKPLIMTTYPLSYCHLIEFCSYCFLIMELLSHIRLRFSLLQFDRLGKLSFTLISVISFECAIVHRPDIIIHITPIYR